MFIMGKLEGVNGVIGPWFVALMILLYEEAWLPCCIDSISVDSGIESGVLKNSHPWKRT
jgi:hypothetical protein